MLILTVGVMSLTVPAVKIKPLLRAGRRFSHARMGDWRFGGYFPSGIK